MNHDFAILTPEKTILTFRLAGLGGRVLAIVIDLAIILAVTYILGILATFLIASGGFAVGLIIILVVVTLMPFVYFILLEWLWNGQTIGKRAMSLRVRMDDGTPITFPASLGRNLLRPADLLVGLFVTFCNPRSQRLGDLVAHTIVVYEPRVTSLGSTMAPHRVGVHPFEDSVGDLRGMTLSEYDALRRLADRFPELTDATQNQLLQEVWNPFAARRNVPAIANVHPLYLVEAVVMKYGRRHGLL